MNYKSILIISVLFLFGAIVLWGAYVFTNTDDQLEESMHSFINHFDGGAYEIKQSLLDTSIGDISGEWWLVMNEPLDIVPDNIVHIADDADLAYFISVIKGKFNIANEFKGYSLYRAEESFGESSICENKNCSFYLLSSKANANVYIAVYKN